MRRVLVPVAALALVASAAAGCKPPLEQSEFINSGMSAAIEQDPSKVPPASPNPPPNIVVPPQEATAPAPQPEMGQGVTTPAESAAAPAAPPPAAATDAPPAK